jgi:pimeloyl-ACP methyl ester carboxylesterase
VSRTRLPWVLAASAIVPALLAPSAGAAAPASSPFRRCYRGAPIDCAIVRVPLDRTGRVAGTIPLHVLRAKARRPPPPGTPKSAVVGLAGGPGQSGLPLAEQTFAAIVAGLDTRDLLVFDQRGTGLSGLLRCRTLERRPIGNRIKAVEGCASSLGAARAFYTTRDSADDIEAVRQAAGVDRVVPYGTSYGTKVALAYAQRYPQRTERLVLDSLVDLDGPDPFSRDTFQAVSRILRDLCADTNRARQTAEHLHRGLLDGLDLWRRDAKVAEPRPMAEFRNFQVATPDGLRDVTSAFRMYHALAERYERVALGDRPMWLVEVDRFWNVQQGGADPIHHWMTIPMLHFEPPASCVRRFWAGFQRLVDEAPGARILCATHSGPIRAFAAWAVGYDPGEPYNTEEVLVKLKEGGGEALVAYRNRVQEVQVPLTGERPDWWEGIR